MQTLHVCRWDSKSKNNKNKLITKNPIFIRIPTGPSHCSSTIHSCHVRFRFSFSVALLCSVRVGRARVFCMNIRLGLSQIRHCGCWACVCACAMRIQIENAQTTQRVTVVVIARWRRRRCYISWQRIAMLRLRHCQRLIRLLLHVFRCFCLFVVLVRPSYWLRFHYVYAFLTFLSVYEFATTFVESCFFDSWSAYIHTYVLMDIHILVWAYGYLA